MSHKKRFDSVADMVRATSDSQEFADSFESLLSKRQLVKQLMVMRAAKGLSQEDMAKELKCSQSRISKLENGNDGDLSLTDVSEYLSALGYQMELQICGKDASTADQIKYHWSQTKRLMGRMVEMAGVDEPLATGIARFFGEACCNFVKIIVDSAKKLPEVARRDVALFRMIEDCGDSGLPKITNDSDPCHHIKRQPSEAISV